MARLQLWEKFVSWAILAFAVFGIASQSLYFFTNWQQVQMLYLTGGLDFKLFLFPLVHFVAAVLLVLRSKWAPPLFVAYFIGSISFLAIRYGLSTLPWQFHLAYILEIGILYFCLHLYSRKLLR
jgi:hypothetical protein